MNLSEFKFLTDENMPPRAVEWLKNRGLDVFDIKKEVMLALNEPSNRLKNFFQPI